jgi:hypothetical protein
MNKIIKYENSAYGAEWYDKMIGVGGDSFNDPGTDYLEGELVTEKVFNEYMTEFEAIKLYASNKDIEPTMTPEGTNVRREMSAGAGHVFFDGHANPGSWNTHWHMDFETWVGATTLTHFVFLMNGNKLPVVCVEGCHNSMYNVSLVQTMQDEDNSRFMWTYGRIVPECWSWWLVRKIGGGSIATLGHTGLGIAAVGEHGDLDGDGINEPDVLEKYGGILYPDFYENYVNGTDILGETWKQTINDYLDIYPGMSAQSDAKTAQQWSLLGDPSLKMGGYE